MSTAITTTNSTNQLVPQSSTLVDGLELMPPDDGSLARKVYDSAADKNNPPLEAVTQYLFKNGYRRIDEASRLVQLASQKRFGDIAKLIGKDTPNSKYFSVPREGAMRLLETHILGLVSSPLPQIQQTAGQYCRELGISKTNTPTKDTPRGEFSIKETEKTLAAGLSLMDKLVSPAIQSLDLFVREQEEYLEIFTFTELEKPKGLRMRYQQTIHSGTPHAIQHILFNSGLVHRYVQTPEEPINQYQDELRAQVARRSDIYYIAAPASLLLCFVGSTFGAPIIAGFAALAAVSAMAGITIQEHNPNSNKEKKFQLIEQNTPFPGLNKQAKDNYQNLIYLEAADRSMLPARQ